MRPYYEDDSVTIYHGDCREILPSLGTVDAVITDPPYGLNIGYGRTALGLRHIAGDQDAGLLQWIAEQASKSLPAKGWCILFCGYTQVGTVQQSARIGGLTVKSVLVWDKGAPTLGEGIRNQYELAVMARKGAPPETWTGGNVWRFPREHGRPDHPHHKPSPVMGRLVDHYSPMGGLVLDPFMGSGSTLRAAKDRGRRAIGIEIEERYCEMAAKRMGQEVMF